MACPKGWESLAPMEAPDRATTPMVRRRRGGPLEPVSWEEALDTFVSRMRQVQADHGPDSVAFLSTGRMPSEEMRSEEHTSELQSLMRISYAVFCLKKKQESTTAHLW